MPLLRLASAVAKARVVSVSVQFMLPTASIPCVFASPAACATARLNCGATILYRLVVMSNSRACLTAFDRSTPPLASTMTSAPEACAVRR